MHTTAQSSDQATMHPLKLITNLLAQKGPAAKAQIQKHIEKGEGVQFRGIYIDVTVLEEALAVYERPLPRRAY